MSSAPTRSPEAAPAEVRRSRGSAVWRLTAAFAAPLVLGAALFVGLAYVLIVRADVASVQTAALNTASRMKKDAMLGSSEGPPPAAPAATDGGADFRIPVRENLVNSMVDGHVLFNAEAIAKGQPLQSFLRYEFKGKVVNGDKGFGELSPVRCPWWTISGLGQCLGRGPPSTPWHYIYLEGQRTQPWGLATRVDMSSRGDGAYGYLYVGSRFRLTDLEGQMLSLALWTLSGATLAALAIGFAVSRQMLRRVEAVNAVADRVRRGDFSARAPGEAADDELGALSRHVNTMLERINALVLGLRDVSNRIAHDLRTPIARLKTHLEDVAAAPTLEAARAGAERAAAETEEILATFQALLDIAEVEAGADGGLQPMRLDEAARAVVDLYDAVADDAGVALVCEAAPAQILGEPTLVVRLAANLVDNAIKFSPRGGQVTVRVERQGAEAAVVVSDQGPGIAPGDRERVLRRFVRADDARSTPGHGLGLALVAAVAKRHGARIRMDDNHPGLSISVAFKAF